VRSPRMTVTGSEKLTGLLVRTETECPCEASADTSRRPTKPLPPVTNAFTALLLQKRAQPIRHPRQELERCISMSYLGKLHSSNLLVLLRIATRLHIDKYSG